MDRFETLTAFVAVADQRSFAAAARALATSPPAITRAIAALEHHLGVRLFHRSTRAVSLTDDGAAFLDRARRILIDLRDAEQVVMGGRSLPRGQLYLTAPVMFGKLHVLPVISALLAGHEGLSARMMLDRTDDFDRLAGERDGVGPAHLHLLRGDGPDSRVEIEFGPLGRPQLAGTHESVRQEA